MPLGVGTGNKHKQYLCAMPSASAFTQGSKHVSIFPGSLKKCCVLNDFEKWRCIFLTTSALLAFGTQHLRSPTKQTLIFQRCTPGRSTAEGRLSCPKGRGAKGGDQVDVSEAWRCAVKKFTPNWLVGGSIDSVGLIFVVICC